MDENFYNFLIEIYKLKEAFFDSETSKKSTESTVSNTLKQMPRSIQKSLKLSYGKLQGFKQIKRVCFNPCR